MAKDLRKYAANLLAVIVDPNFKKAEADIREKLMNEFMKVSAELYEIDSKK